MTLDERNGTDGNVSSLTVRILEQIRDEARVTNQRLDQTNQRLDHLSDRVEQGFGQVTRRLDRIDQRIDHLLVGPLGETVRGLGVCGEINR